MIIDCISDLHGHYPKLEGGDLLIVAGDLTATDSKPDYENFIGWLANTPYQNRVVIAGNHDSLIQRRKVELEYLTEFATYLQDSGCEFGGFKIWGSPWTKSFVGMNPNCKAFCLATEVELQKKWDLIPDDIDILVTHSPPYYMQDRTYDGENAGSETLIDAIEFRIKPKLHVFGHIHEAYGKIRIDDLISKFSCTYVNASHVNLRYKPVNAPIRIVI